MRDVIFYQMNFFTKEEEENDKETGDKNDLSNQSLYRAIKCLPFEENVYFCAVKCFSL